MFLEDINKDEKLAPYAREIVARLDSAVGEYRKGYFNSITGPPYIMRRRIVYNYIANHILDNDELPKGVHFVHKAKGKYNYPGKIGNGGFIDFDLTIKK
jgi:hypothetical protein